MSYSCSDFADDIIDALGSICVPDESNDSPSDQADLCLAEIQRLKLIAGTVRRLERRLAKDATPAEKDAFIVEIRKLMEENPRP